MINNDQVEAVKLELLTKIQSPSFCEVLDREFTLSEIEDGIKRLKPGKASALDVVSNDLLKATSSYIAPIILNIFNYILLSENFPDMWSLGIIVPLFKSGEQGDPNNYRGISINSCISKLFTLLMNDRLTIFTEQNNIIHFNQLGFRKGYRTADHVFTLKTIVDNSLNAKKDLHVCFVDFKKAFDTVWRDGLFLKLLRSNVSTKFVRILKNMYESLKCSIQLPFGLSKPFPSLTGVRQGCNLSPLLFNLFMNDLISSLNIIGFESPLLDNLRISCLLYADDLILISETKEGLQNLLDKLNIFSKQWFLEVNTQKTKSMIFSRKRNKPKKSFHIGEDALPSCETYCYLGCMFSQNGSLKLAAQTLHEKATKSMFGLLNTVNKYKRCPINVILKLFDHLVAPIALYNCEVWGPLCFTKNDKQKNMFDEVSNSPDSKIHFKFLQNILGVGKKASHWGLLSETGSFPLRLRIMTSMLRYWFHLYSSSSPILGAAFKVNVMLSTKQNTWFSQIKKIMHFIGIEHILYTSDFLEIKYQIGKCKKLLRHKFVKYWKVKMSQLNQGKLGFYSTFKSEFENEQYLNVIDIPKIRFSLTRFRIGAHKLPVETGRYKGLVREERVCPHCNTGLGDELHYLFVCDNPIILDLRLTCFNDIGIIDPSFLTLQKKEKLLYLMQCSNPCVIRRIGSFLLKLEDIFKDVIYL